MPRIIDHEEACRQLAAAGFVGLYHHSGAWGFDGAAHVHTLGWIGPDDPTIRPEMAAALRRIPAPHASGLADLLARAWQAHLPGEAWLSPKSHWHYELNFGNPELLESLLPSIGIDPSTLRERNDGSPIIFAPNESDPLRQTAQRLLESLVRSDFQITFPTHRTVCTIHHHQQLWWQTGDPSIASMLRNES